MSQKLHHPRCEPAATIVDTFGGVTAVARITRRSQDAVWSWMRPRHARGTDGEIPTGPRRKLIEYANAHRIAIPADVWQRTGCQPAQSSAA